MFAVSWKLCFIICFIGVIHYMYFTRKTFSKGLIRGKRVLVTGGSTGIGEQLAYQYAMHGASVFITARREIMLKQVIEKCKGLGTETSKFGYQAMDMMDLKETENLIKSTVLTLGGLDVLILNHAYIPRWHYFTANSQSFQMLNRTLTTNVMSSVQLAAQALPYLREGNGSIGVVNSMAGKIACPLLTHYTTSKHALDGFFSSYREELRSKNINVSVTNCVLGLIKTDTGVDFLTSSQKVFNLKGYSFNQSLAEPNETAYDIMRGVTLRQRQIYCPDSIFVKLMTFLREFITNYELFPKWELLK